MKLSIFPKAKALPKTKDEKIFHSKFASSPYLPEIVEITSDDELIEVVTSYAWSPAIYSSFRKRENFVSTDFMTLDIDDGLTIEEAEVRCNKFGKCFLILPTTSHTPEHNKFRLIFPLVRTITSLKQYTATWERLHKIFPELDKQCSDVCRFYFASSLDDGVFCAGPFLEPAEIINNKVDSVIKEWRLVDKEFYKDKNLLEIIYKEIPEKIPESVDNFLRNAPSGLPGSWRCSLNAFVFSLALMGVEEDKIVGIIEEVAPDPLDKRDINTITVALRDGKKAKELNESDNE